MKIHPHLIHSVADILNDIFVKNFYADKVLEFYFKKNKKWGARDRRFVAESTYDIVRWWLKFWNALERTPTFERSDLLDVVGVWLVNKNLTLPIKFNFDSETVRNRYQNPSSVEASLSLPRWIYDLGLSEVGQEWDQVLTAMNEPARVVLRVNSIKTTTNDLRAALFREGIEVDLVPEFEDALVLRERSNVFRTRAFQQGWFEVQDAASQMVAKILDPRPGERIIDACAGAGGKSLHLASLMRNKGRIISMDVEERKLDELRTRSSRAGADIIEARLIDSSKVIKRLKESCDRLLLDVPCSGTGVWKRNPDSKWKLTPEELTRLRELQTKIITTYPSMLKPGGTLVYATCSVFRSENEEPVRRLLRTGEWNLESEHRLWPHRDGFDGFYIAKLVRK